MILRSQILCNNNFLSRYIFYMNGRTILKRLNLINGHGNEFPMKSGCTIAYQDYNNKQLYCHQKNKDGKDIINSIDYDGNVLRNITINGLNFPAIAVFKDFLYVQRDEKKIISEINISTGVVSRKIFLPRALFQMTDLAIIDRSIYQTGNHAQELTSILFQINIMLRPSILTAE